jgi:hypothetical protein
MIVTSDMVYPTCAALVVTAAGEIDLYTLK